MTVRELIEGLKRLQQDADVWVSVLESGGQTVGIAVQAGGKTVLLMDPEGDATLAAQPGSKALASVPLLTSGHA